MVLGKGEKNSDPVAALKRSYEHGVTDEFVEPLTIVDDHNQPVGLIRDDDACIFFNFRADRAREMTTALTDQVIEKPSRSLAPKNLHFTTMTEYDKTFKLPFVLPREHPNNILADVMAQLNWKNLRVAETEKYAHVTYFFNGGNEKPYAGESRELVPSPKVATYDLKPEMSAPGVTDVVVKAIEQGDLDVIVMNYANADMVGHSGKMAATVQAVEAVDAGLGEHLRGPATIGRIVDHHRRSWQCRDHDRPGDQGPAHLPHHQSGAVHSGRRNTTNTTARRSAAGYFAHPVGIPQRKTTQGNDRKGSAFMKHSRFPLEIHLPLFRQAPRDSRRYTNREN